MVMTDFTRTTSDDFKDFEGGICWLYGAQTELLRLFLAGNCSIEFVRVEYQRYKQIHDELHERFIKPLASQLPPGPVVQLPRL